MVDGGHIGLAATYLGATLLLGYACVRAGIALERRPEAASPARWSSASSPGRHSKAKRW